MYRIQGGDQKEYGPITADQVKQWIADKRLNRFSLCAGADGIWKPLGQFSEFADVLAVSLSSIDPAGRPGMSDTRSVGGDAGRARALQSVKGPAMAMIVVSAILLMLALVNAVSLKAGAAVRPNVPGMDENMRRMMDNYYAFLSQYGFLLGLGQGLMAAIGLAAGLRLRVLKNFGLVTAGAVLLLLPFCNSCCCLGLPLGVWVIIVMNRADVKPYFE